METETAINLTTRRGWDEKSYYQPDWILDCHGNIPMGVLMKVVLDRCPENGKHSLNVGIIISWAGVPGLIKMRKKTECEHPPLWGLTMDSMLPATSHTCCHDCLMDQILKPGQVNSPSSSCSCWMFWIVTDAMSLQIILAASKTQFNNKGHGPSVGPKNSHAGNSTLHVTVMGD